ncbi:BQ5605_C003g02027 [Microbotryum silenes-dioicae]|uniref:BQ5605_C003g02027 protein n=1 Tax=Microbotryum silenes-dioicae TaxID=796604 RepID=A0A2X0MMJ3_9BASI|nr:BQ5605_C003g02027 [Microbotryum silenes-dioicae]
MLGRPTELVHQLAMAPKATTGVRRRCRPPAPWTPPTSATSAAKPPVHDLVGAPCPLSNLRPVYYAPLFPELHKSPSTSRSPHPYSLAEFPSTSPSPSPSSLSPSFAAHQHRLPSLKAKLHAQDLEYRLNLYRLDALNQNFWARTNADFLAARERWLCQHYPLAGRNERDIDLSSFYAQHLAATKHAYQMYNAQLWRATVRMMWPALKAARRKWRWKWEVWKHARWGG